MAIMWQLSRIPLLDPNGAPYSGAKVYFFDANTTTPRTVYADSALGESHDHPVAANSAGMFPAIFLPPGLYRQRVTNAAGTVLFDDDGISTPTDTIVDPGDGGDTPVERLLRTGDLKPRYDVGAHSGFVRANGRTIGNAGTAATERANSDCEDLFKHLWTVDTTLTVSGGRGVTADADWSGSKRITLPSWRGYPLVGLDGMGNSRANVLSDASADTLGATIGAATVTLTEAQIAIHRHYVNINTNTAGDHSHGVPLESVLASPAGGTGTRAGGNTQTGNAGNHVHNSQGFSENTGGGAAHSNVPPTKFCTIYIKL